MNVIRQFNQGMLSVANWGVIISMGLIAIVVPYEVFGRYVLNRMGVWSFELCQYSLVWATMLGGAVGLKKGYQVGITSLTESLSPAKARIVFILGYGFMLFFLALMTVNGVDQMMMNQGQVSSSIGISMSIPYAAMPIGFFMMFLITIEQLLDCLFPGTAGTAKEE